MHCNAKEIHQWRSFIKFTIKQGHEPCILKAALVSILILTMDERIITVTWLWSSPVRLCILMSFSLFFDFTAHNFVLVHLYSLRIATVLEIFPPTNMHVTTSAFLITPGTEKEVKDKWRTKSGARLWCLVSEPADIKSKYLHEIQADRTISTSRKTILAIKHLSLCAVPQAWSKGSQKHHS